MSENKKDNAKYAMSYIPLVAFFFYFMENNKSKDFSKHLKYGMILFLGYFIISFVLRFLFLGGLTPLLFLAYIIVSAILGYKAYNGEEIDVEILDDIGNKIQDKIDNNNKSNNKEL